MIEDIKRFIKGHRTLIVIIIAILIIYLLYWLLFRKDKQLGNKIKGGVSCLAYMKDGDNIYEVLGIKIEDGFSDIPADFRMKNKNADRLIAEMENPCPFFLLTNEGEKFVEDHAGVIDKNWMLFYKNFCVTNYFANILNNPVNFISEDDSSGKAIQKLSPCGETACETITGFKISKKKALSKVATELLTAQPAVPQPATAQPAQPAVPQPAQPAVPQTAQPAVPQPVQPAVPQTATAQPIMINTPLLYNFRNDYTRINFRTMLLKSNIEEDDTLLIYYYYQLLLNIFKRHTSSKFIRKATFVGQPSIIPRSDGAIDMTNFLNNPVMIKNENDKISRKSKTFSNVTKDHIRTWFANDGVKDAFTEYYIGDGGVIMTGESTYINKGGKEVKSSYEFADIYPAHKLYIMILFIVLISLDDDEIMSWENPYEEISKMIAAYILYAQAINSMCAVKMERRWNKKVDCTYVYNSEIINGFFINDNLEKMIVNNKRLERLEGEALGSHLEELSNGSSGAIDGVANVITENTLQQLNNSYNKLHPNRGISEDLDNKIEEKKIESAFRKELYKSNTVDVAQKTAQQVNYSFRVDPRGVSALEALSKDLAGKYKEYKMKARLIAFLGTQDEAKEVFGALVANRNEETERAFMERIKQIHGGLYLM